MASPTSTFSPGSGSTDQVCRAMRTSSRAICSGVGIVIDRAIGDGGARHAIVPGRLGILGEGNSSLGLDGLEPERSIGAVAGEDDADGSALVGFRQRAEQLVDGHVDAAYGPRDQGEGAIIDRQGGVRGAGVDVVGLDLRSRGRFVNRQGGGPGQDVRQTAFEMTVQVHDDQDGQPRLDGQAFEQSGDGLQPASRCANADDGKARGAPVFAYRGQGRIGVHHLVPPGTRQDGGRKFSRVTDDHHTHFEPVCQDSDTRQTMLPRRVEEASITTAGPSQPTRAAGGRRRAPAALTASAIPGSPRRACRWGSP